MKTYTCDGCDRWCEINIHDCEDQGSREMEPMMCPFGYQGQVNWGEEKEE